MSPKIPVGTTDVTLLLDRWREGDQEALGRASEIVYPELRRIAHYYLRRERSDHTLQPTALIHEAFLRLNSAGHLKFESRKQFFALAAQLMRRILVDHARSLKASKRGGGALKVPVDSLGMYQPELADQFLTVHQALEELAQFSPRKAQVIELRYFAGLNLEEIAAILGISTTSTHREQRLAEAWLMEKLSV
jgi:RNA polymerase sigma-70 factor (ECF subfamily)